MEKHIVHFFIHHIRIFDSNRPEITISNFMIVVLRALSAQHDSNSRRHLRPLGASGTQSPKREAGKNAMRIERKKTKQRNWIGSETFNVWKEQEKKVKRKEWERLYRMMKELKLWTLFEMAVKSFLNIFIAIIYDKRKAIQTNGWTSTDIELQFWIWNEQRGWLRMQNEQKLIRKISDFDEVLRVRQKTEKCKDFLKYFFFAPHSLW